jgi:hypothetical protein
VGSISVEVTAEKVWPEFILDATLRIARQDWSALMAVRPLIGIARHEVLRLTRAPKISSARPICPAADECCPGERAARNPAISCA